VCKNWLKIPNRLGKISENRRKPQGGIFWLTLYLLRRLQSVLNAAARLRPHLRRAGLPPLAAPPWENRVQDRRIDIIKLSTDLRQGTCHYLGPFSRVADLPSRRSLHSVDTNRLVVPIMCLLLVAELFRSLARRHGMTCRQQNHWPHFVAWWRHTCSGSLFNPPYT